MDDVRNTDNRLVVREVVPLRQRDSEDCQFLNRRLQASYRVF